MTTSKLAIGSIIIGIIVLLIKMLAYYITGSIALYSDALESTVNIATAFAALIAVRLAAKPADDNHPYGHHKAEYFSAVLEGVMITLAAILILQEAWQGLMQPKALNAPVMGLAVNALASLINGIWCYVLIKEARRLSSPALTADGWHLFSDVISSLGVTIGVGAAILTGWYILDPLLAALVALNILYSGGKILKHSMGGLMDEAVEEAALNNIQSIIAKEASGAIQAHDIKTRKAGNLTFIDFHLVVPGQLTVSEAHDICDRIEDALEKEVQNVDVSIHVEPEEKAESNAPVIL
ncbi:MAG: cadmium transporter [Rhodomicrobium sp.]|nr:MAG: cadmium transporter [Rhodomicrobium sp.]